MLPLVEARLGAVAARLMRAERSDHTLQPTAIVDEAYVRLLSRDRDWEDREEYWRVASAAMRRLLARHARDRGRLKRGGQTPRVQLDPELFGAARELEAADLEDAFVRLEALQTRLARVAEFRLLAGLSVAETARSLEVSERTVALDWVAAKAWLRKELAP